MALVGTAIEIDQEALATAAEVLGTSTTEDTVNTALREVGQRLVRLRALARIGEMADNSDFDEFLNNKAAYRRWPSLPPPVQPLAPPGPAGQRELAN